jgi:hypothetical protein
MPTTSTLAINGSLVILATYLISKWLKPRAIPGIPHHPITSIWGDLPALGKERDKYGSPFEPGAFFSASHERLGPLYQVSAHGCIDTWVTQDALQVFFGPFRSGVLLNDPQECEDLLLRSASKLEISYDDDY